MATKRQSTTRSVFGHAVPERGKYITFDRLSRDWYGYFNGLFIGARAHRRDIEAELDALAYETAKDEGYRAGFTAALARLS